MQNTQTENSQPMQNETTCGICMENMERCAFFSPMSKYEYSLEEARDSVAHVSRIHCGHAFHATCLVKAFCVSALCPTCRTAVNPQTALEAGGEPQDADNENMLEYEIMSAARFLAIFPPDEPFASDPTMHIIRSAVPAVQLARSELRTSVRDYNRLRDRLRHLRRKTLQTALSHFRRRNFGSFRRAVDKVEDALEKARNVERTAWLAEASSETNGEEWERYDNLDACDLLTRNQQDHVDPFERRFWNVHSARAGLQIETVRERL